MRQTLFPVRAAPTLGLRWLSTTRLNCSGGSTPTDGGCGCGSSSTTLHIDSAVPRKPPGLMTVDDILLYNKEWAAAVTKSDPGYFKELNKQQSPQFLWIGCSDSRVPANQIMGLPPGEVFVHRNIANVVVPSDLNCLSVLQFAVEHLKVRHVIVCGHYNCGGVRAALQDIRLGLADNWTRHVRDIHRRHTRRIAACGNTEQQLDLLCQLNVMQQLHNVADTTVIRDAWARGSDIELHGWIYGLSDGVVQPLVKLNRSSPKLTIEDTARRLIQEAHAKVGVRADIHEQ